MKHKTKRNLLCFSVILAILVIGGFLVYKYREGLDSDNAWGLFLGDYNVDNAPKLTILSKKWISPVRKGKNLVWNFKDITWKGNTKNITITIPQDDDVWTCTIDGLNTSLKCNLIGMKRKAGRASEYVLSWKDTDGSNIYFILINEWEYNASKK